MLQVPVPPTEDGYEKLCFMYKDECTSCQCLTYTVFSQLDAPQLDMEPVEAVKKVMAKILLLAQELELRPLVEVEGYAYFTIELGGRIAFLGFALNIFASIAASMYVCF